MAINKPILGIDCGDLNKLSFPKLASPKLDGVRALKGNEDLLSRTLKPIPNRYAQKIFRVLPEGLDGELILGDPQAKDVYRRTVSCVMSEFASIEGLYWYLFDVQKPLLLEERLKLLTELLESFSELPVKLVPQVPVGSLEELLSLEEQWVEAGYEGLMLRSLKSPYKHGRSTLREGYLLKLKRFCDSEAFVVGITELQHNLNEPEVNELGYSSRSSKKEGKVASALLGSLIVWDLVSEVEFEIGSGFTLEERAQLFAHPPINRVAKYKYFPSGGKDKPRHPTFLGWRED